MTALKMLQESMKNNEGDLLFEIEKDNIFVEPILSVQFASYHIKQLFSQSQHRVKKQRECQLREWFSTLTVQFHNAVVWLQNTMTVKTIK
jgi:hypothetical protein